MIDSSREPVGGTALFAIFAWLAPGLDARTFWLETAGIAGFTAFWLIQTQELGGFIDRDDKAQKMLATQPQAPAQPRGA